MTAIPTNPQRQMSWNEPAFRIRSANVGSGSPETQLADALLTALPADAIDRRSFNFADVEVVIEGADNGVVVIDVALIRPYQGSTMFRQQLLGSVTFTAGQLVGAAGEFITDTERMADTIAISQTPFAIALAKKYGLPVGDSGSPELLVPNSQASNGIGSVLIAELHDASHLRFAIRGFASGATAANGLLELHT